MKKFLLSLLCLAGVAAMASAQTTVTFDPTDFGTDLTTGNVINTVDKDGVHLVITGSDTGVVCSPTKFLKGSTIAFSVADEYQITGITFNACDASSATNFASGRVTAGTMSASDAVVTWEPTEGTEPCNVIFTMGAMAEVSSFSVTYAEADITRTATQKKTATLVFPEGNDFSSWGTSYGQHDLTFTEANVNFSSGSKQSSTIKDMPVSKKADVTITMNEGYRPITDITLNVQQWSSKAQTINTYISTDGTTFTQVTGATLSITTRTSNSSFSLAVPNLPEGVIAVKFSSTNSSNQIGWYSAEVTYETEISEDYVAAPVFSRAEGIVDNGASVTLSCETEGATIYYTTDGTGPTTESTEYTGAITINETVTIKAIAALNGNLSTVATATYTVVPYLMLGAVEMMDDGSLFRMNDKLIVTYVNGPNTYVTDENGTAFGLIYKYDLGFVARDVIVPGWLGSVKIYNGLVEMIPSGTLNKAGTADIPAFVEVESASTLSKRPVNSIVVIKDVTFAEATPATATNFTGTFDSSDIIFRNTFTKESTPAGKYDVTAVVSVYTSTPQYLPIDYAALSAVVYAPTFSVEEGTVEAGTEVELSCETEGATIYYTTDGTEPTTESAEYTGAITINKTVTIKAIAALDGIVSEVATATYTVLPSNVAVFTGWPTLFGKPDQSGSVNVTQNSVDWTAVVKGVTLNVTNGTSTNSYLKDADFRVYSGYAMTFTAPEGCHIVSITSTKGGLTFSSGITASPSTLKIENSTISWTGSANSVKLDFTAKVSFATITVTFEEVNTYTLAFDNTNTQWDEVKAVLSDDEGNTATVAMTQSAPESSMARAASNVWTATPELTFVPVHVAFTNGDTTAQTVELPFEDNHTYTPMAEGADGKWEMTSKGTETGIEAVEAAEGIAPVYYNLQGVRVANPAGGIYIRVAGNDVKKVIVK